MYSPDWPIGSPSDWSMTQHGPWLRVRPSYIDCYRWWDRRAWQVSGRLREYWYYWKCRLWTRWNVLHIKSLPVTWMTSDEVLLHAAMTVLTHYIEEYGGRWSVAAIEEDLPTSDEHSRSWLESALPIAREEEAIYNWWTQVRPKRPDPTMTVYVPRETAESAMEAHALEQTYIAEDDAMLNRLIAIRRYLVE